jgi:hypothetical protein
MAIAEVNLPARDGRSAFPSPCDRKHDGVESDRLASSKRFHGDRSVFDMWMSFGSLLTTKKPQNGH